MANTSDITEDDPELKMYTTAQVATLLEVSEQTVRNWISREELKALKFDKRFRIRRKDLIDFINSRYGGD